VTTLPASVPAPERAAYSFEQLADTGVLWMLNRVLFHPRGFALALDSADGESEPRGWSVDAFTEPVTFGLPEGMESERLAAFERLLSEARTTGRAPAPSPAGDQR